MNPPSMNTDFSYKHYHEEYIANNNGTTAGEVFLAVAVVPPFAVLQTILLFLKPKLSENYNLNRKHFLVEFCCIVLPSIAAFTIFSNYLAYILVATTISCIIVLSVLFTNCKGNSLTKACDKKYQMKRRACITYIRAVTNLATALCILAVDFKIFPQRFSKTETYGFSVMDIGVGIYVAVNALVAPEARGIASHLTLRHTCMNSIPLFILGTLRLVATQMLNYQQHVSEYGVHWNFFFTLGITKILSCILVSALPYLRWNLFLVMSLALITCYEISLNFGLKEWVLGDTPRIDFLSSNREGILSSFGYIAIYLCGLSLGQLLFTEKVLTLRKNLKLLAILTCGALVCWMATYGSNTYMGISRRLANMGYFVWIITFTISTLCLALCGEIITHCLSIAFTNTKEALPVVPHLFETTNCHGLLFFLLANILTGLVNLSIKTLYIGPTQSFVILTLYMLTCCGITSIYHVKKKCKKL